MSLLQSFRDGVKTIKINRPERKNAFDYKVYVDLTKILNEDAQNDSIVLTILTGDGDYFSSGNDIKSSMSLEPGVGLKAVSDMIQAVINYPKLLICVVNGIAIGIGATLPALCDIVYASDKAVFDTPFVKLSLCAEGCSSYNYPSILGRSVASEVLLLGKKLTAEEAFNHGLVAKVVPHSDLSSFIDSLHKYGSLPVKSIIRNKGIIVSNFKDILTAANKREFETLVECVNSDDFSEVVMNFLKRKSKL